MTKLVILFVFALTAAGCATNLHNESPAIENDDGGPPAPSAASAPSERTCGLLTFLVCWWSEKDTYDRWKIVLTSVVVIAYAAHILHKQKDPPEPEYPPWTPEDCLPSMKFDEARKRCVPK